MMTSLERIQILQEEIAALDHRSEQAQKEKLWAQNLARQKRIMLHELQEERRRNVQREEALSR